ncbi:putative N-acetyltransferase p20 [Artemisia annua]|uniref:Putative N-acetyltransferase p20 n=1 Tax=Artemisia annua TaxID=35608 RepID=A0A2U1PUG7_ARTAN|nr:putative N-acetyltransferase p20 [Artemisia annua]
MNPSNSLTLRPFKLSDADDILEYFSDDQVTKFLYMETITTKEEALAYITNVCMPLPYMSICINDRSIGGGRMKDCRGCYKCGEVGHIAKNCALGCCKCGEVGHIARNCNQAGSDPRPRCTKCGDSGHIAKDCSALGCCLCGEVAHLGKDSEDEGWCRGLCYYSGLHGISLFVLCVVKGIWV